MNLRDFAALEQSRGGAEEAHAVVSRFQQLLERLEHALIVVDCRDNEARRMVDHEEQSAGAARSRI